LAFEALEAPALEAPVASAHLSLSDRRRRRRRRQRECDWRWGLLRRVDTAGVHHAVGATILAVPRDGDELRDWDAEGRVVRRQDWVKRGRVEITAEANDQILDVLRSGKRVLVGPAGPGGGQRAQVGDEA